VPVWSSCGVFAFPRLAARSASRPSGAARLAVRAADARRRLRRRILTRRHRMMQDYPLNLSISLSGGEETNQDALSNGE